MLLHFKTLIFDKVCFFELSIDLVHAKYSVRYSVSDVAEEEVLAMLLTIIKYNQAEQDAGTESNCGPDRIEPSYFIAKNTKSFIPRIS